MEAKYKAAFVGCVARRIDGPGLHGGSIIYQGHIGPSISNLKGHLCYALFTAFDGAEVCPESAAGCL